VQHAELEAVVPGIASEQFCQIAAFLVSFMAYAVDNGKGGAVFFKNVLFRRGAKNCDVVRPGHRRKAGGKRVVVAVRQKNTHPQALQANAAVAQGKLRLDAVVFLIVNVPGQHKKIRLFRLTETKKAFHGCKSGFTQQTGKLSVRLGNAPEWRVKVQVSRVNVS
jgi:hypothetical protein